MVAAVADRYPSRFDAEERILNRLDPIVYGSGAPNPPIDEASMRRYRRDGFIVLENCFSDREIQVLQRETERLRTDRKLLDCPEAIFEPDNAAMRSLFDVQKFSPLFEKLMRDARLVEWARYFLDDDIYLHQSRLNFKPGFHGREFYWHSDFETWHVEDGMPAMRALSMSLALTDNHASNGPVMLIPGSHRHYVSCAGITPDDNYKQSLRRQQYGVPSQRSIGQLVEGNPIQVITCPAGSVLLFDCNTMHGSSGNITPHPRNNLFFVYNAIGNRLQAPYCGQKPRPDYVARRDRIEPIEPIVYRDCDYGP